MPARWQSARTSQCLMVFVLCAVISVRAAPSEAASEQEFTDARAQMLIEIRENAESIGPVGGRAGISQSVLDVMGQVPRHEFVPQDERSNAYQDRPLAIGRGQTISQPYIVALMTELLQVQPHHIILEVGTGSGYQAAVLSSLCRQVYSIELIPALAEQAKSTLKRLGITNVTVRQGDGYYGWPEQAPFDGIMVTAGAPHIPPQLIQQLKPGGRMVIPVGEPQFVQDLMLVEMAADGSFTTSHLLPVRFVPLKRGH